MLYINIIAIRQNMMCVDEGVKLIKRKSKYIILEYPSGYRLKNTFIAITMNKMPCLCK